MRFLLAIFFLSFYLFAGELKIIAASNLKQVLEEIKQEFLKDYPNSQIQISYSASGKAYMQIKNGLEADLFFSADTIKPQKLFEEGFGLLPPQIYALGRLVLTTAGNANISTNAIFKSKKIKHIAIANPKLAPYGEAGVEFLKKIKLYEEVQSKLVLGDSIGQALSFVKTQSAEVGLNALSLVIFDSTLSYRILDKELYPPIEQSFLLLKQSKNVSLARAFMRFVLSDYVQKIFLRYGYERNE